MTVIWRQKRSLVLAILKVIGIAFLATGCSAVHPSTAVGTGTYSYATGALSWIYPVTIERLWLATLAEVDDLRLQVLEKRMDGLGGTIKALRADKIEVDFELIPVSTNSTELSVRILGHEYHRQESEHIHAKIRQRLGMKL